MFEIPLKRLYTGSSNRTGALFAAATSFYSDGKPHLVGRPSKLDVFKKLKPLGDIERYQVADYRKGAVRVTGGDVMNAVSSRPGEAGVLLGNPQPHA